MSIIQRQLLWGIIVAFTTFITITISVFMAFPIQQFTELWEREVFDVPFILFSITSSLTVGAVFGGASGLFWRQQLEVVENRLREMKNRQYQDRNDKTTVQEVESILSNAKEIQRLMSEQVEQSQKMANEKVEDQQKRVQEVIIQERNRLARELHDSVSQQLFAASMLMSALTESTNEDSPQSKQLKMVEGMINQSQLEMRALLLHLRPAALKGKSLQEGIAELLLELAQKVPMELKWNVEEFLLDKGVEDHLFRIAQESVSNALRHSKASMLKVLLVQRDSLVILRIEDDGIGFDVEMEKVGSYGLQNMHERAVEVGATLKIVSLPNQGTKLEVKVPLIQNE
ncbi:sensor histidine kinase [Priestia flexa]|uniref:sensor histidine kinase n=1 Tax=Priestia TaxID=2800373 RepID=UPI002207D2CA|nr:sensor histidine kinase [Bacillus sp. 1780r2a1]